MRHAPALQALLAQKPPSAEAVRQFLAAHSFPIVHGPVASVVWQADGGFVYSHAALELRADGEHTAFHGQALS